jgi:hypothetical protein
MVKINVFIISILSSIHCQFPTKGTYNCKKMDKEKVALVENSFYTKQMEVIWREKKILKGIIVGGKYIMACVWPFFKVDKNISLVL